jgi:PPP family 3-phenylpropionic acid transporter
MKPLHLARLYYFLYFGAVGCYFPYVNLYFQKVGLSGKAIGVLAALGPLILLGASPAWGALGDRFRVHRYLLPLATGGSIIPVLLMPQFAQFAPLAALTVAGAFFSTAINPLIDSAVLDLVVNTEHAYGGIRVWGSIGFTLVTWGLGYVIKAAGLDWLFYSYAVLMALAALVALALPPRRQTWQTSFRHSLTQLLRQKSLALFFVSAFLCGAAFTAFNAFFSIHLVAIGGNEAWVGLAGALGAIAEMPILFYSPLLFRKLGVRGSLGGSFLMYVARWLVLAFARSPVLVLLTQLTHGVTYGAFLVGGVAYVDEHTPPGLSATAQGLFVATTFGLGAATGAAMGGWLYEARGAMGMFLGAAAAATLGLAFLMAAGKGHRQERAFES